MAASGRRRNPRGEGDRLRQELLAAAMAVLDDQGNPADVTVRGVAARVGVAPNAVYLHFDSRDALVIHAVIDRLQRFTEDLQSVLDEEDDPLTLLRRSHRTYMAFAKENPGVYRATFGHRSIDPDRDDLVQLLQERALPALEVLVNIVRRSIAAGVLPALDPDAVGRLFFAAGHGWSDLAGTPLGALLPDPDDLLDTLLGLASGIPSQPAGADS